MDISMKDPVLLSVFAFLHRKPNKVTEKAIKQVQIGKGIKKFDSFEEMLKDLNN